MEFSEFKSIWCVQLSINYYDCLCYIQWPCFLSLSPYKNDLLHVRNSAGHTRTVYQPNNDGGYRHRLKWKQRRSNTIWHLDRATRKHAQPHAMARYWL